MSLPAEFIDRRLDEIVQLLKLASVAQCSILVQRVGRFKWFRTFYKNGQQDKLDGRGNGDDTIIYAIGSLTKLLVPLLICIIVDKLSLSQDPTDKKYRRLRKRSDENPWNLPFTTLFNRCSDDVKMSELPRKPTLRQVLLHFNSLPPMNSILFGPDGTSLLSTEQFLRVAPLLAQAEYGHLTENYAVYSNGNYILAGLLVQAIAQDTIANLMEMHIFDPLRMMQTYMFVPKPGIAIARPHIVSIAEGTITLSDPPVHAKDDLLIPAMGAYSTTRDMAILLETIQESIDGVETIFPTATVADLLGPEAKVIDGSHAHTICGILTTFDTSIPGSKSINRLITPDNVCSTYELGYIPHGNYQLRTYYMAGAVDGYASCLYYMQKWKAFVIVLTNTSGLCDASDHISRLLIQELFQLEHGPMSQPRMDVPRQASGFGFHGVNGNEKVDILDMTSRAVVEGRKLLEQWSRDDTQKGGQNLSPILLPGTYLNQLSQVSIVIEERGDGSFVANIRGEGNTSGNMQLIRTGERMVRLSPLPGSQFSIERYDHSSWRDLSFDLGVAGDETNNQRVVSLTRYYTSRTERFERFDA